MDRADDREAESSRRDPTDASWRGETTGRQRAGAPAPSRVGATRRRVLAASGAAVAGGSALASAAAAVPSDATGEDEPERERPQEETTTDGGGSGAAITTTMAIERVPEFDGNYESQFLVVQSTRYSPERTPGLDDCSGVDWTLQNTQSHEGALLDRITDDAQGVRRTIFIADDDREFRPGDVFVVSDATECGDYVALGVEGVGPRSLAGKQTVDTVGGGGEGGGDGSGSTPGFSVGGAMAGLAALVGLGAARRATDDE